MASTTQTLGNVVGSILKTLSRVTRSVADTFDTVVDFAYVKIFGLPFIVLGYRQTGKTTLIEWLRADLSFLADFQPDPTAAGGDPVPIFSTEIGADGQNIRVKLGRDVGGEYSMWETDWITLFRETRPRGIIFLIDHTHSHHHKDALNYVLQMLEDEPEARKRLQMFLLLVNKSDLWADEQSLEDMLDLYRNEVRRLKSQSERLSYNYHIGQSCLIEGNGPREELVTFFDAVRPRPQTDD